MPTPTSGNFAKTYLHFFINNGQRYCGIPGIYHAKIDNGIFEAIRSRVVESDIPAAEIAETDTRLYGVLLRDEAQLASAVWWGASVEYQNQPEGSHNTNTMAEMHQATNGEVYRLGAQIKALQETLNGLVNKVEALVAK